MTSCRSTSEPHFQMTWIQRLSKMNHGVKLFFTHDVGNNTQFITSPLKHVCSFHHTDRGAIAARAPFFERRHTAAALSENNCTVVFGVFFQLYHGKTQKDTCPWQCSFIEKFSNTHPCKKKSLAHRQESRSACRQQDQISHDDTRATFAR